MSEVHVEVVDSLKRPVSLSHVEPGNEVQVVRLVGRRLHLLSVSHLSRLLSALLRMTVSLLP